MYVLEFVNCRESRTTILVSLQDSFAETEIKEKERRKVAFTSSLSLCLLFSLIVEMNLRLKSVSR